MRTLRGRSGEMVEMLERSSLGICVVQETRFRQQSVGVVSGIAEYKLFWTWNEKGLGWIGTFLAEKWVAKVIESSSDRQCIDFSLCPTMGFRG